MWMIFSLSLSLSLSVSFSSACFFLSSRWLTDPRRLTLLLTLSTLKFNANRNNDLLLGLLKEMLQ
jgi:hypothetical protein